MTTDTHLARQPLSSGGVALRGADSMVGSWQRRRPRVLVIEDDAATADLYGFLLEAAGYDVRTVGDGDEAMAAARAFRPTVIVSDIDLPGCDGFTLAGEFRADPAFGHTPMVAVSGRADRDCAAQARRAGFAHFLPKPVAPETLSQTLSQMLDRRRRQERLLGPDRRASGLQHASA